MLKIRELDSPKWLRQKYWEEELTTIEIGNLLGCDAATVLNHFKKFDIPRRKPGLHGKYEQYRNKKWLWEQYIEKELSSGKIANRIGCDRVTVCRWLNKFNIPKRGWDGPERVPSWNDKFFDELTPESAYIIGFLIADGTIRSPSDTRNSYSFSFTQKDSGILIKIGQALSTNKDRICRRSDDSCWDLVLCSEHAWFILVDKYNIPAGREKSYTVKIPDCILKRDDLLPHCIRGIFDGDGSVREKGGGFRFYSGSIDLLNDISDVLTRLISLPNVNLGKDCRGYIKKDGTRSIVYFLDYGDVLDAIDFARFIYGPDLGVYGSILYLERKRVQFQLACDRWRGREWLCEQIGKGRINKDIATELGMPIQIVSGILNKIGVYDLPHKDPEWLQTAFVHRKESIQDIAKTCGVKPRHVKHYINKYGLREARSRHWNLELGI